MRSIPTHVTKVPDVDRELFDQTLSAFYERRPFRPFTVAMNNGDRLEVDHPRALAFRLGFATYISPGGVPVIFDSDAVSQVIGDLAARPAE